ncbi:sugar phosphate isomerase/epimerase family protein [Streptacidiphilus sp. N1-12]|uniref:Sugar phosphate isomerase/epimerase family protein n=2 Tax=Streptacidiphilus alkalitolerans TaxID=3342712 RepID=A0ABV6WFM4_9ACTN
MTDLALSTLGLPSTPLRDVLRLAADSGYAGLELRCAADEPVHTALTGAERRSLVREFSGAGVVPLSLAGYAKVAAPGADGPVVADLRQHLRLAADLGARYLRVFPGGDRAAAAGGNDDRAVRRLSAVADLAASLGVQVGMETHDSHAAAADVARVLDRVPGGSACGIWDMMHTHLAGEQPGASLRALAGCLGYVQVKDARPPQDLTPLPLGAGTLPLREVCEALRRSAYGGWLVWEYEARWYPRAQLLDPHVLAAASAWLQQALAPAGPRP